MLVRCVLLNCAIFLCCTRTPVRMQVRSQTARARACTSKHEQHMHKRAHACTSTNSTSREWKCKHICATHKRTTHTCMLKPHSAHGAAILATSVLWHRASATGVMNAKKSSKQGECTQKFINAHATSSSVLLKTLLQGGPRRLQCHSVPFLPP